MTIQYDATHRANNMGDLVSRAGATAFILLYSAAAANCAAAASGTLLASIPCNNPIGTVASGVLTFNVSGMSVSSGVVAGTAVQWRLCTSSGGTTCIAQGDVGTTGASIDFAGGPTFAAGQTVQITGLTITAAGA
jgi:hypothetical protein